MREIAEILDDVDQEQCDCADPFCYVGAIKALAEAYRSQARELAAKPFQSRDLVIENKRLKEALQWQIEYSGKEIARADNAEAELRKAADFSRDVHEMLEKAHDVLILCERWFDSSRVRHHRDCKLADECDCGVEGVKRKIKQALASPHQAEVQEKL